MLRAWERRGGVSGENEHPEEKPALLFDGLCNLCSWAVQFIIKRDPAARITFASLQSNAAQKILRDRGVLPEQLNAVVFVNGERLYLKSAAVLHVVQYLSGPWRFLRHLILIPEPLRDWCYDRIANSRYRIFGRRDSCLVPTKDITDRFLEGRSEASRTKEA